MTTFEVKPLTARDVPDAARLLARAFNRASADNRADLYKELRKGEIHTVVAAYRDNALVGVARSVFERVLPDGSCEICVYGVTADSKTRGQGVGKAMLAELEKMSIDKWLGQNEGYFVLVDASKKTFPGSTFYEDQGYVSRGGARAGGDPVLYKFPKG